MTLYVIVLDDSLTNLDAGASIDNQSTCPLLLCFRLFLCFAYYIILNVALTQASFTAEGTAFTFKCRRSTIGIADSGRSCQERCAKSLRHDACNLLILVDAEPLWMDPNNMCEEKNGSSSALTS